MTNLVKFVLVAEEPQSALHTCRWFNILSFSLATTEGDDHLPFSQEFTFRSFRPIASLFPSFIFSLSIFPSLFLLFLFCLFPLHPLFSYPFFLSPLLSTTQVSRSFNSSFQLFFTRLFLIFVSKFFFFSLHILINSTGRGVIGTFMTGKRGY